MKRLLVTASDGRFMDLSEYDYLFSDDYMPARFPALFQRAAEACALVEIVTRGHGMWLMGTGKRVLILTHNPSGERMEPPLLVTISEAGQAMAERPLGPRRHTDAVL